MQHSRLGCAACGIGLFVLLCQLQCWSTDVIFIRARNGSVTEQQQLETVTRFYGVDLVDIPVGDESDKRALQTAIEQKETRAVIVAADALGLIKKDSLMRLLSRRPGGGLPLLIMGVTTATQPAALESWTSATVANVRGEEARYPAAVVFGSVPGITRQLSGLELPLTGKQVSYFALTAGANARQVMAVRNEGRVWPTFIQMNIDGHDLFVAAKTSFADEQSNSGSVLENFAPVAPAMIFVRYAVGDWGWHAAAHYANLTIDDPWLREPYGYVNYAALLREMEKHDFHTTIAFIPWNYDRSQTGVISLFRNHPERFSICIHGDNHDHQEFPALKKKPLDLQAADVRESLNRMSRFQELTGIPYDRVMIFPHNIGSQEILGVLKAYNFLATVNSSNIPIDGDEPSAGSYPMRPVTLQWSAFPSLGRVPAGMPNPAIYIGVNAFLDNPLLFYCHHEFFAAGIGAFDTIADDVNKIEPATRWASLGDAVKHMYLLKLRSDSDYDVLAFSNELMLDSVSPHGSVFYIRKLETGSSAIVSVNANGQPIPFRMQDGYLNFSIAVPRGETCHLAIVYASNAPVSPAGSSNASFRVYFLRMASDFRDITMSRYALGRMLTGLYYQENIPAAAVIVVIGTALVVFGGCAVWIRRAIITKKRSMCKGADVTVASPRVLG